MKNTCVFGLGFLMLLLPSSAMAFEVRMHGSECYGQSYSPNVSAPGDVQPSDHGLVNYSSAGFAIIQCPVPDSTNLYAEQMNTIDVYGYDGNSTSTGWVTAWACTSYWGSNGGRCSQSQSTQDGTWTGNWGFNFGGYFTSSDHYDFKYIQVELPKYTNVSSSVRGIWFSS